LYGEKLTQLAIKIKCSEKYENFHTKKSRDSNRKLFLVIYGKSSIKFIGAWGFSQELF
jgi:hypothetical protein